jgi:flagellum-specific peptidoglycan hydrolase FlgJ
MLRKPIQLTLLFVFSLQLLFSQKTTTNFIDKFLPVAKNLSKDYGIPVSIILGVSILESGGGTSINCKQLHNYFGVTGKNSLKKRRTMYKQYENPEDSFTDFCKIMSRKRFYIKLKNNDNYSLWLQEMNKANYASAKHIWVSRVKGVITKHKLFIFDKG